MHVCAVSAMYCMYVVRWASQHQQQGQGLRPLCFRRRTRSPSFLNTLCNRQKKEQKRALVDISIRPPIAVLCRGAWVTHRPSYHHRSRALQTLSLRTATRPATNVKPSPQVFERTPIARDKIPAVAGRPSHLARERSRSAPIVMIAVVFWLQ